MNEEERQTAIKFGEAIEESALKGDYSLYGKITRLWVDFVSQYHGSDRDRLVWAETDARTTYRNRKFLSSF